MLERFDYIRIPPLTGEAEADALAFLMANGKPNTARHVRNVARQNEELARRFALDAPLCRLSGILHDVSAVIRPRDMLAFARAEGWPLCRAEEQYPFLLHQRLSALLARDVFGVTDQRVLSPVSCHTTLKPGADKYDMALFISDKLAWDQEGEPPFYEEVEKALSHSLERACYTYMAYMIENGKVLCPHDRWTAAFAGLTSLFAS